MNRVKDLISAAGQSVWNFLKTVIQRDRAAREAQPQSAESPLIVIPIPRWRTYVLFLALSLIHI